MKVYILIRLDVPFNMVDVLDVYSTKEKAEEARREWINYGKDDPIEEHKNCEYIILTRTLM